MKRTLLLALAIACSIVTFAQNDTYKYLFNNSLMEKFSKAPALLTMCTGVYGTETIPAGGTKRTYRFDKGCGLIYDDSAKNFLASGGYTIELYFRLDTITGYTKLVDFDSLKVDAGIYNQNGRIVLYPSFTSLDSFVGANVFQYVAVTRAATTKKMYINANGKTAGTYTDNTDVYKLGADKLLTFFRDDKATSGEHSKGAVGMIYISNYALDSNTIKSNYTNLSKALDVPATAAAPDLVSIYPNPVSGIMHVTSSLNGTYVICDITGKACKAGSLQQGDNKLALDLLPDGLYFLKVQSMDSGQSSVYRFSRH